MTVPSANVDALEFGRTLGDYLYAGAGAPAGVASAALYQIDPVLMAIRDSVTYPYVRDGFRFAHLAFDSSSLMPGRYLYALMAGTPGWIYQFDTGRNSIEGLRMRGRFTLDTNYNVDVDSQLAFVASASPLLPDYLYFSQYVNPGIVVRFDVNYIGLVLRARDGFEFQHPVQKSIYAPKGAQRLIIRGFGVQDRTAQPIAHLCDTKTDFDTQYAQMRDDVETVKNAARNFAYFRDFAPDVLAITRPVSVDNIRAPWLQAPHAYLPEIMFELTGTR
jgi:hypothetical protein